MSDTAAFVIRSFSFLFLLPSALSILQILFYPPGFQRIFGFREVSTGQGLLSHAGGYLCPVAFLPYIAFLCIQFSRYVFPFLEFPDHLWPPKYIIMPSKCCQQLFSFFSKKISMTMAQEILEQPIPSVFLVRLLAQSLS